MSALQRRRLVGASAVGLLALFAAAADAFAQTPAAAARPAPVVAPAQTALLANGPPPAAIAAPDLAPPPPAASAEAPPLAQGTPLKTLDGNRSTPSAPKLGPERSSTMSIVLVLALAAAMGGAWYWKQARQTKGRSGPTPSLRVLSRMSVGYRSELLVVDLEGRRMLLGMTPGSIQALTELPDERERNDARAELDLGPDVTFSESLRGAVAGSQTRRAGSAGGIATSPASGRWPDERAELRRTGAEAPASRRAADDPLSRRLEARAADEPPYEAPLEQQVRGLSRRRAPRDV